MKWKRNICCVHIFPEKMNILALIKWIGAGGGWCTHCTIVPMSIVHVHSIEHLCVGLFVSYSFDFLRFRSKNPSTQKHFIYIYYLWSGRNVLWFLGFFSVCLISSDCNWPIQSIRMAVWHITIRKINISMLHASLPLPPPTTITTKRGKHFHLSNIVEHFNWMKSRKVKTKKTKKAKSLSIFLCGDR